MEKSPRRAILLSRGLEFGKNSVRVRWEFCPGMKGVSGRYKVAPPDAAGAGNRGIEARNTREGKGGGCEGVTGGEGVAEAYISGHGRGGHLRPGAGRRPSTANASPKRHHRSSYGED